jgi:DNA-directed RNA polymerase specialized sigma24 family protein
MRCLAELPIEQREIIVLKIWNRLTFDEIGNLLEISPNTAAGRYRYGLQKLKKQLSVGRDVPIAPEDFNEALQLTSRLAGTLAPPV